MMKVFVGLSHKGGTGRSVTIANLAYRFATKGKDVCIIDLDLASPTMGAILGLSGIEAGVSSRPTEGRPCSIADLLDSEEKARQAKHSIVDVWKSPTLHDNLTESCGKLSLIPGQHAQGDECNISNMDTMLIKILEALEFERYDAVFIDARSGLSKVLEALDNANYNFNCNNPGHDLITAWLVHFRWTHQHLIGLADLLGNTAERRGLLHIARASEDRICLIRTAFIDPKNSGEWFSQRHNILEEELNKYKPESIPLLGDVPLDPILQWQECIITPELVRTGVADEATDKAFSLITDSLLGKN